MIFNAIILATLVLLVIKLLNDASDYEFAQRLSTLINWPTTVMIALSVEGIFIRVVGIVVKS